MQCTQVIQRPLMPEFSASFCVISLFHQYLHRFYPQTLGLIQQAISLLASLVKRSDFDYVESDAKIKFGYQAQVVFIKYDLGLLMLKMKG